MKLKHVFSYMNSGPVFPKEGRWAVRKFLEMHDSLAEYDIGFIKRFTKAAAMGIKAHPEFFAPYGEQIYYHHREGIQRIDEGDIPGVTDHRAAILRSHLLSHAGEVALITGSFKQPQDWYMIATNDSLESAWTLPFNEDKYAGTTFGTAAKAAGRVYLLDKEQHRACADLSFEARMNAGSLLGHYSAMSSRVDFQKAQNLSRRCLWETEDTVWIDRAIAAGCRRVEIAENNKERAAGLDDLADFCEQVYAETHDHGLLSLANDITVNGQSFLAHGYTFWNNSAGLQGTTTQRNERKERAEHLLLMNEGRELATIVNELEEQYAHIPFHDAPAVIRRRVQILSDYTYALFNNSGYPELGELAIVQKRRIIELLPDSMKKNEEEMLLSVLLGGQYIIMNDIEYYQEARERIIGMERTRYRFSGDELYAFGLMYYVHARRNPNVETREQAIDMLSRAKAQMLIERTNVQRVPDIDQKLHELRS